MNIDQAVERHRQALREMNADSRSNLDGPFSTVRNPEYFTRDPIRGLQPTDGRKELHLRWITEVIDSAGGGVEGQKAVVMAGPPGAGKGTVQNEILNLDGYVVCDPDMFKEKIVDHELNLGKLDLLKSPQVQRLEAQGELFAPMDFSSMVHKESTILRDTLQTILMTRNLNLVIDTVLSNDKAAETIMKTLDAQEYTYQVVSVQASMELTKAGIQGRWEQDYRAFLNGENTKEGRLGGRPVPSEFANSVYGINGVSVTEAISRKLAEHGKGAVSYQQYRRSEGQPHVLEVDLIRSEGKLVPVPHSNAKTGIMNDAKSTLAERIARRADGIKGTGSERTPGDQRYGRGGPKR